MKRKLSEETNKSSVDESQNADQTNSNVGSQTDSTQIQTDQEGSGERKTRFHFPNSS